MSKIKPKFILIKQFICQKIESGQWLQHSKVPSENELAEQFNVSRMTARRALQDLTEQGTLVRSQGAGTFVATFKSQSSVLEIRNIADEIIGRNHQHSAQPIMQKAVKATSEIAILLNIKPSDVVYYSEILHFETLQSGDAFPIQLEQRYVNPTLVPEYLAQNFSTITSHEYLSSKAPLTEATHEIEAIIAEQQVNDLLEIKTPQACLQIKRRTWSSQGVVSFAILTSPGDKYRLGGHLTF
jgi:GntR family transcriptional regulator, histidine utilization repressor